MRNVCVVVTARPSYSRIQTALSAIRDHPALRLQLVAAASAVLPNYGRVADTMRADGFTVVEEVYSVIEGENLETMADSVFHLGDKLAPIFKRLKPDIAVTIADRYETIATSIAASYQNISLAHLQGGEITGTIDDKVRNANTMLADIHLVSNSAAAGRVWAMTGKAEAIHVTGCPSIDIARKVMESPALDFDPISKYGGVGDEIAPQDYLVVMQHPVTTEYAQARQQITETLKAVAATGMPAFWFWPNVDAGSDGTSSGIRAWRELVGSTNLRFFKNMEPQDHLRLIYNARALVGNSSVGIRECSYLGVPVVNIGTREQGRERGANVLDVGHDWAEILAAIEKQAAHGHYPSACLYGDGHAGERIADVLATAPLAYSRG